MEQIYLDCDLDRYLDRYLDRDPGDAHVLYTEKKDSCHTHLITRGNLTWGGAYELVSQQMSDGLVPHTQKYVNHDAKNHFLAHLKDELLVWPVRRRWCRRHRPLSIKISD